MCNFEEKANRKIDEEGPKKKKNVQEVTVHRCQRGEEEREERRKKVGRVGGRRKRKGMGGTQSRKKKFEGWGKVVYCHEKFGPG